MARPAFGVDTGPLSSRAPAARGAATHPADQRSPGASAPGDRKSIAYIVGTYPILTTTFIDREIAEVRDRDVDVRVISLRRPRRQLSPEQRAVTESVDYVLPVGPVRLVRSHLGMISKHPSRYLRTLVYLLTRSHPSWSARWKTLMHFGEAIVVAWMLERDPYDHIHAHFVDRAATVAMVCSRLLGIPYSATAHANDIYVNPVLLAEKVRNASVVVTCTRFNGDHLRELATDRDAIAVIHHGLDLSEIQRGAGARETNPPVVLAVGQLREKKGFRYLIEACGLMAEQGLPFSCVIIGHGPLEAELREQLESSGLESRVQMTGALPHEEVLSWMRRASVFTLPAVVASDGDRDGIPNVILEAMALRLPVVSTRHSGIPEAVSDGESGLLVEPGDPRGLAEALSRLLEDPELIERFGSKGREIVERDFALDRNVGLFLNRLGVR